MTSKSSVSLRFGAGRLHLSPRARPKGVLPGWNRGESGTASHVIHWKPARMAHPHQHNTNRDQPSSCQRARSASTHGRFRPCTDRALSHSLIPSLRHAGGRDLPLASLQPSQSRTRWQRMARTSRMLPPGGLIPAASTRCRTGTNKLSSRPVSGSQTCCSDTGMDTSDGFQKAGCALRVWGTPDTQRGRHRHRAL